MRGDPEPLPGLGPRVTPAPAPAPAPVRRPDGFVVHPDGTLSTDFAPPPGMAPSTPPHTPAPADPGAHGFMREPLKVGDRVRLLVDGARRMNEKAGATLVVIDDSDPSCMALKGEQSGREWFLSPLRGEGVDWERIPAPIAPERLKVGDRVLPAAGKWGDSVAGEHVVSNVGRCIAARSIATGRESFGFDDDWVRA